MTQRTMAVLVGSLFLAACSRQVPSAAPVVPPPPSAAKGPAADPGAAAEASEWKIENGPADAKVELYCFFPMNEDHAWIKVLNKKIVAMWPGKVRVVHIDWWSDEGGKVHKQKFTKPCSAYVVDGKSLVEKSQSLGGWTEESLLKMIGKLVEKAYGKDAAVPQKVKDEAPAAVHGDDDTAPPSGAPKAGPKAGPGASGKAPAKAGGDKP